MRHKTAQYLQRAEVLQRTHSSDECSNHLHEEVGQLPYRPTSDLQGKQSTAARVLSALESPPASLSYLTNIHQHSTSLDFIERPVHVGPRLLDYRVLRPVGKVGGVLLLICCVVFSKLVVSCLVLRYILCPVRKRNASSRYGNDVLEFIKSKSHTFLELLVYQSRLLSNQVVLYNISLTVPVRPCCFCCHCCCCVLL